MGLRTTQFFLAGPLDTVSGVNGRVVDGRRNIYDGAPSEIDPSGELRRARQLVSCAALWASGQLDVVDPHDRQQLIAGAAHACHVRLTSTSSPVSPNDDG